MDHSVPDVDMKVEKARLKNKQFLAKGAIEKGGNMTMSPQNIPSQGANSTQRLSNTGRNSVRVEAADKIDTLTPYDIRNIKDHVMYNPKQMYNSFISQRNSSQGNIYGEKSQLNLPNKYGFLMKLQMDKVNSVKKLSPRLKEFCYK